MDLAGIISISGRPGLYKVIAQGKNNIIVESLENGKRFPAYSSDRISALEDISIYTYEDEVSFKDVLKTIYDKEGGKTCIPHKAPKNELEAYLEEVIPNYDRERVYVSDVKKIFQWYNQLHKADLLKFEEEKKEKKKEEKKEEVKEESKPKAKSTAKKPAAKASTPKAKSSTATKGGKTSGAKKAGTAKTGSSRGK